jgi:uroporphyrinogen-III synthase
MTVDSFSSHSGFSGQRVVAFETRRNEEMRRLIAHHNGRPRVVPSMREVPLQSNAPLLQFHELLVARRIDVLICMTGVGTRMLAKRLEEVQPREAWIEHLRATKVVARGPKPLGVLREMQVPASPVAQPNTWREVLVVLEDVLGSSWEGAQIVIQDFPTLDERFVDVLEARGARVLRVPVYRYALPEDDTPLRHAVYAIIGGGFDVALFTTGVQVWNLFQMARQLCVEVDLLEALNGMIIGSVGPTNSEVLRDFEVRIDVEPQQPRMGHLVKESAAYSTAAALEKAG